MVRFLRKCGRIDDLAVMEVSQMVGVRTRAMTMALAAAARAATVEAEGEVMIAKRRREEGADSGLGASEMQMSYLRLRNRSLVITQRLPRSTRNSRRQRRECIEQERMSRCSSISSCEALEEDELIRLPSSRTDETPCKDLSSMCNENCSQDRSEMSWSCNAQVSYPSELDSTVERQLPQSKPQSSMPCLSEIEEFFDAMEKAEKKRFTLRYNFDIDEDVPLEGRYEWVRINQ